MELSDAEIKIISSVHQEMDSGKIGYVILKGERIPLLEDMKEKFGLVQGQTIDMTIFKAMKDEAHRQLVSHLVEDLMKDLVKDFEKAKKDEPTSEPVDNSEFKPTADMVRQGGTGGTGQPGTHNNVDTSKDFELSLNVQAGDEIHIAVEGSSELSPGRNLS